MTPTVRIDAASGVAFATLGVAGAPFSLRATTDARRSDALRSIGFGGWSPTVVHVFDPDEGVVHFGSGLSRPIDESTQDGRRIVVGDLDLAVHETGLVTSMVDRRTGLSRLEVEHDDGVVRALVLPGPGRIGLTLGAGGGAVVATGVRTEFTLSDDGWLSTLRSPTGGVATVTHADGLLRSIATGDGQVTSIAYDEQSLPHRVTHANGLVVDVVRQETPHGIRTALVRSTGSESATVVETDDNGVRRRSRWCCGDRAPHVVETGSGFRVERFPDGSTIERRRRTSEVWGDLGSGAVETLQATPGGQRRVLTTNTTETTAGSVETRTIDGARWVREFDRSARTVTTTTPEGRRGTVTRDEHGRTVRVEAPGRATLELTYDADGRVVDSRRGDRRLSVERDDAGRVRRISDDTGRVVLRDHEPDGSTITEHLPGGRTVTAAMGPSGDQIIPPGRPPTSFDRIDDGWRVRFPEVDGDDGSRAVRHDLEGRVVMVEEPHGTRVLEYRTGSVPTGLEAGDTSISATFEPGSGRVAELRRNNGEVLRFTRDGSLVTSVEVGGMSPATIRHHYERHQRVATEVGGFSTSFERDRDGLLTGVGPVTLRRDDVSGALVGRTMGSVEEEIRRDENGRTTEVLVRCGDRVVVRLSTTYDDLGRRSSTTETVGDERHDLAFGYDESGRLTSVTRDGTAVLDCRHDENGNRTRVARGSDVADAEHDAQDRIRTFGDRTLRHDSSGRLVEEAGPRGRRTYEHDDLGAVAVQIEPDGARLTHHVDPYGRRVATEVDGELVQRLVWDGTRLVAVLDGQGAVRTAYGHGDRHHPEWVELDGIALLVVADHVGSIRALVDPSDGTIVRQCEFDVDGRIVGGELHEDQPIGFVGGVHSVRGPLVRLGARDYHPDLARFTSRDPLLFGGGSLNLYTYPTDPVNWMDPTGMTNVPASGAGADYSDRIPSQGVSVCATDFMGAFEHGMVGIDGRVYGQDGTADRTAWTDQTSSKVKDDSLRCEEVPDVDAQCIKDFINEANRSDGTGPYLSDDGMANMCWNQVWDAMDACGGSHANPKETVGDYAADVVYEGLQAQRDAVKAVSDAMSEIASWFD